MKLRVVDRLVAFSVLPQKASFDTWQTLRNLQEKLTLDEDEKKAVNLQVAPDGQLVTWDPEKEVDANILLSVAELKLVQDSFKKLDKGDGLTAQQADVMGKFMDAEA